MTHTQEFIDAVRGIYELIRQIPDPDSVQFTVSIPQTKKYKYVLMSDGSYADRYRLSKQNSDRIAVRSL